MDQGAGEGLEPSHGALCKALPRKAPSPSCRGPQEGSLITQELPHPILSQGSLHLSLGRPRTQISLCPQIFSQIFFDPWRLDSLQARTQPPDDGGA